MPLRNLTPHSITISNLTTGIEHTFEPSGTIARVSTTSQNIGFCQTTGVVVGRTVYGEVEGLTAPKDYPNGVLVSGLVLGRLGSEWSGVAFAPATGPNDNCIRDSKGMIQAVTKLVTV